MKTTMQYKTIPILNQQTGVGGAKASSECPRAGHQGAPSINQCANRLTCLTCKYITNYDITPYDIQQKP